MGFYFAEMIVTKSCIYKPLSTQKAEDLNLTLRKKQIICFIWKISGEVKAVHAKNPGDGVLSAAKDVGAAMIVTGSRGLGVIRRTILGSVSDYILHHSNIPVAVCHQKS